MKQVRRIAIRLLFPPKPVLILLLPAVFAALIALFVTGQDSSMLTVPVYMLSAYCLTILVIPMPKLIRNLNAAFSADGPAFRRMMNAITGGFVWGIVIAIAVYMLLHSAKEKVNFLEQSRK